MTTHPKPSKVLVIGSGPIVIGPLLVILSAAKNLRAGERSFMKSALNEILQSSTMADSFRMTEVRGSPIRPPKAGYRESR